MEHQTPNVVLSQICQEALARWSDSGTKSLAKERLDAELEWANQPQHAYSLVVGREIVEYAKENCFLLGPGRGIACCSLVAYLLGITEVNPLAYNLGPGRFFGAVKSYVAIDIDSQKFEAVLDFLRTRYGENCQIMFSSTLWDPDEVFAEADITITFENGQRALLTLQGLRVLTKLSELNPNREDIPLDDPRTFALFGSGKIGGIFNCKGKSVKKLCSKWKPLDLQDLATFLVIRNPGQVENFGYILKCRADASRTNFEIAVLTPWVRDTYGLILYQEQLEQIFADLAGFDIFEANALRKVIWNHQLELRNSFHDKFTAGCLKHGLTTITAESIWEKICQEETYTCLRGSTIAYALLTYRSAYFQANN